MPKLKFDKSNIDKSPDGVATAGNKESEESISSVGRDKAIVEADLSSTLRYQSCPAALLVTGYTGLGH